MCYYHTDPVYVGKPGDYYCSPGMRHINGTAIKYSSLPEAKIGCDELPNCAVILDNCAPTGVSHDYNLCTKSATHKASSCGSKLLLKGIYRNYNLFNRTSRIFILYIYIYIYIYI